ncbi:MAG TPA: methionyl-tRNA formyltransferase [Gemmatimonadales bacterium]|nr:methionyl-tRNA formyltransferase [Gemmatimonadales bacterium]
MRIVFFGTPEFAVPSLRALLAEADAFTVAGVVTQPDRPRGRSRSTLIPPPVKAVALEAGIPVLQPDRPVGDVFRKQLEHFRPDIGVVVAYGHILRPDVLALPPRGMVNVHASLLPRHRGAAPINWAILAGDRTTGVSIMQMEAGLDTGPVYHRVETPIEASDTAGSLTERLSVLGAGALLEALTLLQSGLARGVPQDDALATLAPKITRDLTRIDWTSDAVQVARQVRAFDPAPGAWTTLEGAEVKLFGPIAVPGQGAPGTVVPLEDALMVVTGVGAVRIEEIQPAGRSRMPAAAWLRGRRGTPPGRFQ